MSNHYYQTIIKQLRERSVEATLGVLGLKSEPLRKHLTEQLVNGTAGASGMLANPVFEAVFPWTTADVTLQDLSGNLLHPSLVRAMDAPPGKLKEQAFKKESKPYSHQLRAWRLLNEPSPKSLVVTSGTGSGKTECFMVPILNDLARQQDPRPRQLVGVQALFIYPLNALINSQRERLSAWTNAYGDKVRFCLYNGNTPEHVKADEKHKSPNEVLSRQDLRALPPPLLITNPTMLEYMLIRNQDKPIIDQSKGKLKWIVLDEAHTYIGSQAAELSLLIRRALHAFEVEPEEVRFIATSATIGTDASAQEALKKYLADLAGINIARIEIIDGKRHIPVLPEIEQPFSGSPAAISELLDQPARQAALLASPIARRLRDGLKEKPRTLSDLTRLLFQTDSGNAAQQMQTLAWLDVCSDPGIAHAKASLLPLRGHLFHRVVNGLWACIDRTCSAKQATPLHDESWHFGKVYTHQRLKCECGAPVYEMVFCNECNTVHLHAYNLKGKIIQAPKEQVDEFSLDVEPTDDDGGNGNPGNQQETLVLAPFAGKDTYESSIDNEGVLQGGGGDGTLVHVDAKDLTCAKCEYNGAGRGGTFRHAYLGTPFYISTIVPTLLEHCPDGKDEPLNRPMRGRALITFTDSRQGTARIAAKMQQDAERTRTRGLVYQILSEKDNVREINALEDEIRNLSEVANGIPAILTVIRQKQNELQQLLNAVTPWEDVVDWLQNNEDVQIHMRDYYRYQDPVLFADGAVLAKILLVREFSRRPKRANSPETLGLVAIFYLGLHKVERAPHLWLSAQLTLSDWKDFLKIALDFYVRDGVFVNIHRDWLNWLGGRFTPKYLLAPHNTDGTDARHRRWPQFEKQRGVRQHRLLRLLGHVLGYDVYTITNEQIDILNELMAQAWTALTSTSGILSAQNGNYQLELNKLQFKLITKAWYCPVTLRVLDTTLCGYTPYLPVEAPLGEYKCEGIEFPRRPALAAQTYEDRIREIRDWVAQSEAVGRLRNKGIWTDQSDRIVEGGVYFRSAEHSAQQPAKRLSQYEQRFKEGRVNVLSCSTTMEMGVDIGGLSIVCNNNVPPHPANYLQRAGRAGRRSETRSLSLTISKDNPHDQAVFRNPLWAFTTQLRQPNITLSSERIVQRHINALLLGYMLKEELRDLQTNAIHLQCGWFFSVENGTRSICDRMIDWIEAMRSSSMNQRLQKGIKSIIRGSVLEGHPITSLTGCSVETLQKISQKWTEEYNHLREELEAAAGAQENDPYKKRIVKDLERHQKEYLLSELVAGGFLPGYGFPTGIATFNPYTVADYRRQQHDNESREDNLVRYKAKPSRNLAMALREYAPGADVVLDGLVYKSEGLSLNWHIPDDNAGIVESQKMRKAWRCGNCGSSGTAPGASKNRCLKCTNCHSDVKETIEFIQPTGFSTGFYSSPSNDVSTQSYIPSEDPWIDAGGPLKPLPNAALGFYKSDPEGNIFYYSSGQFGTGYALCLACGKAESMKEDGTDPGMVDEHNKLRGRINGQGTSACEAGPNRIKRNLHLGYYDKTDVFELYLKYPRTKEFIYSNKSLGEDNYIICWTLAVAFRNGLAACLGINTEELGVTVKPARIEKDEHPVYAICLYDTNGGGAGFATSAPQYLEDLFKKAKASLECKAACEDACEHCLIQHDTRRIAPYLNRKKALSYLSDELLKSIQLPAEDMLLGAQSVFCTESFFAELDLASKRLKGDLLIYLHGPAHDWDIAGSSLKRRMSTLCGAFEKVRIIVAEDEFAGLKEDQKQDLFGLVAMGDACEIGTTDRWPCIDKGVVMAHIQSDGNQVTYASKATHAALLNEHWGNTDDSLLIRSSAFTPATPYTTIPRKDLLPRNVTSDREVPITTELNGDIAGFGDRFWSLLEEKIPHLTSELKEQQITKVSYTDPYLASPLTVMLLSSTLNAMADRYLNQEENPDLEVLTLESDKNHGNDFRSRTVFKNWYAEEEASRRELIKQLLAHGFTDCTVTFATSRSRISHARILTVHFLNGNRLTLRLDQGVGYWSRINVAAIYPFEERVEAQVNWIREEGLRKTIRNDRDTPTYVFKSSSLKR